MLEATASFKLAEMFAPSLNVMNDECNIDGKIFFPVNLKNIFGIYWFQLAGLNGPPLLFCRVVVLRTFSSLFGNYAVQTHCK